MATKKVFQVKVAQNVYLRASLLPIMRNFAGQAGKFP